MLKDITLGQYFPGNSVIHRLDPRTKLIITILYIAALFTASGPFAYLLVMCYMMIQVVLSKIKPGIILKGLRPLVILITVTAILNMFYTPGRILVQVWILTLTYEGIVRSVSMILRIVFLVIGSFLLTYTTSPLSLTDGLERLMGPLKRIKFPAHELSMMMSTALRFIPTLIEETDKIMSAQRARGANFDTGNFLRRAKALLPVLVPLFISAFRRADDLAVAMESRCYIGGKGRTRMTELRLTAIDFIWCAIALALLAAVIIMRVPGL